MLLSCTAAVIVLVVVGRITTTGPAASWRPTVDSLFTDANLGNGRIAMGLAATLVIYRCARRALRVAPALVAPLATLGRRWLDCYLILSVVVIGLPVVVTYRHDLGGANIIVAAVVFLCWAWCTVRDQFTSSDSQARSVVNQAPRSTSSAANGRPSR